MLNKCKLAIKRTMLSIHNRIFWNKNISEGVTVHYKSKLSKDTKIGRYTNISGPAYISGKVTIGNFCAIAHNLRIRANNHNINYPNLQNRLNIMITKSPKKIEGEVIIGHNVWIGDNVIILPGVRIGNGSVIGAGSVVTKDIRPYSISVGVPAQTIRLRFDDDKIELLENIQWWNLSLKKIKRIRYFFDIDLSSISEAELLNIEDKILNDLKKRS